QRNTGGTPRHSDKKKVDGEGKHAPGRAARPPPPGGGRPRTPPIPPRRPGPPPLAPPRRRDRDHTRRHDHRPHERDPRHPAQPPLRPTKLRPPILRTRAQRRNPSVPAHNSHQESSPSATTGRSTRSVNKTPLSLSTT